jgi:hypothetical protein
MTSEFTGFEVEPVFLAFGIGIAVVFQLMKNVHEEETKQKI